MVQSHAFAMPWQTFNRIIPAGPAEDFNHCRGAGHDTHRAHESDGREPGSFEMHEAQRNASRVLNETDINELTNFSRRDTANHRGVFFTMSLHALWARSDDHGRQRVKAGGSGKHIVSPDVRSR